MRLRCGIRTGFRMVFASFLSLLLLLMVVLIVVSFDVGFLGAVIAPIGPCIALVEGYVLSDSLAFRKAGCAAPFRVALPGLPRNFSARHDRAVVALPACSPSFCARRGEVRPPRPKTGSSSDHPDQPPRPPRPPRPDRPDHPDQDPDRPDQDPDRPDRAPDPGQAGRTAAKNPLEEAQKESGIDPLPFRT